MGLGPAHHIFKNSRPGPARPIIFANVSARSGPARHMAARPMKHGLYMGRPDNCVGRPMCCSAPKRACTHYPDVKFNVNCLFFVVFSRLDSVGQLHSAHETHRQYSLLTQSCSTNDSVGWLPVGHHLLVLLQRPQQQQEQQLHVLLQHPVLLPGQERHAACVAETARSVACTRITVRRL